MKYLSFLLLTCMSWTLCIGQNNPLLSYIDQNGFSHFNPKGNSPELHVRNDVTEKLDSFRHRSFIGFSVGRFKTTEKSILVYNENHLLESETSFKYIIHPQDLFTTFTRVLDTYQYNNMDQVISHEQKEYDEAGNLKKAFRSEFTYHPDHGFLVQEINAIWDVISGEWINNYRVDNQYNPEGRVKEIIASLWDSPGTWREYNKNIYIYNDLGDTISHYVYFKNNTGRWSIFSSLFSKFNEDHQLVRQLFYGGYHSRSNKIEFTYNADGSVASREVFYQIYLSWVKSGRSVYEYSPNGLEITLSEFYWNSYEDYWEASSRYKYAYSLTNDLLTYIYFDFDKMAGDWIPQHRTEYVFDENVDEANIVWPAYQSEGSSYFPRIEKQDPPTYFYTGITFNRKLLYEVSSKYRSDLKEWFPRDSVLFFYSGMTTGIVPDQQNIHTVFPNPTSNEINIHAPGLLTDARMDIFNLEGQLVKTCTISQDEPVSLDILSPGLYSYRIRNGSKFLVGKIVKE